MRSGQPCQDFSFASTSRPRDETFLVLACADGAGSASHSRVGAELACTRITRLVFDGLQSGLSPLAIDQNTIQTWFGETRAALEEEARQQACTFRDLACTLILAIIGENDATFAQIGDGAVVVDNGTVYEPVFWPQSGEYANVTFFLTDDSAPATLLYSQLRRRVDEVALFTDGLQMLALDYAKRTAHAPFFATVFRQLRNCPEPDELFLPMREYLDSEPVNNRTDDDKSLVIATRRVSDEVPTNSL